MKLPRRPRSEAVPAGAVVAVHAGPRHAFSKPSLPEIELLAGHGVRGDAHAGARIQHRSRVAKDPSQPNLRQVHLLHDELLQELKIAGFEVEPGQMGENLTTSGLPILDLSEGTRLQVGSDAVLRVTGLRNPCSQIETFKPGLMAAVLGRTASGELVRKAGVMCVVERSGTVRPGDAITLLEIPARHAALQPV